MAAGGSQNSVALSRIIFSSEWDDNVMKSLFRLTSITAGSIALLASSTMSAGAGVVDAVRVPSDVSSHATQQANTCSPYAKMMSMSLEQRVGQLFMVGAPAATGSQTVLNQISTYHLGNVFLSGRSTASRTATARITSAMQARVNASSTANLPLMVATDQEGGYVQVLQGPGFSKIPTALTQGTWSDAGLQHGGTLWGSYLAQAGVNLNLAPVAGTIPNAQRASTNKPLGIYQREYGYSSYVTADKSADIVRGMAAAGVGTVTKHFPGLGLADGNTDTDSNVHDRLTTSDHPYLNPFTADVKAGATAVMMSSAIYDKIDPSTVGVFSKTMIGLVRKTGFSGPIMTDDVGNAAQLSRWTPNARAINALVAGVDLILTVNSAQLPGMYNDVLRVAKGSTYWLNRVNSAAWYVLVGKARMGLLPGCGS